MDRRNPMEPVPLQIAAANQPLQAVAEREFRLPESPNYYSLQQGMKATVLLRNKETGQYYAGPAGWVRDCAAAHDFETVEGAVQSARTQKLAGAEVVLRYEDPACDLVLPVRQEW